MLNKLELVNFINEKLNEIDSKYKFNIVAEVGETKAGYISGILLTNEANTPNIPNYEEANYSFTVAILVPSARTNKNFLAIEKIIGDFVSNYDATEQTFDGVDMTLAITPGKPETLKTDFEVGDCVPLYFTIKGLWGNNVTSTKKHWFLDNVEIPFETEGIYLQKDGRTNKIQGIYNTQTLPTGVTKQYRFTFPYSSDFAGLQQDILSGDFKKIYTLKYYDGVSYTAENPFTTKVSLFASGDNNSARTRAAKFNVTFTDVDDGETATKYYIALIDNPFDNQTEDTRWFNSQAEQQAWFADKITNGCKYEQIKAPNLNSVYITSQIYENTSGYDMLSLVNKNYAIIKIEKTDSSTTPATITNNYLYYFVENCQIGANEQYLYDLKLDSIQTYLFDPNIEFSDCFIEKSHLNRWVEVEESSFELLTEQPSDWSTNYGDYYKHNLLGYTLNGNKNFTPYFTCQLQNGFYKMLTEQPSDWNTNYGNYYFVTKFTPVTSYVPFVAYKFIKKSQDNYIILTTAPEGWTQGSFPNDGRYLYIETATKNSDTVFALNTFYKKIYTPTNSVKFDASINSKLFVREDFQNLPKRLTNRTVVGMHYFPTRQSISDWLNENVLCWIYYYFDPLHNYTYNTYYDGHVYEHTSGLPPIYHEQFDQNIQTTTGVINDEYRFNNTTVQSNTVCLCAPIYKSYSKLVGSSYVNLYHRIYINGTPLDNAAIKWFINHNGGESGDNINEWGSPYLLATKVSYCHPFTLGGPLGQVNENGDLELTTLLINENIATQGDINTRSFNYLTDGSSRVLFTDTANDSFNCFLNFVKHDNETSCNPYLINQQLVFNKSEIIGADKDIKFNPKLLSTDFKEIKLSDQNEDGFSYDLQKLNIRTLLTIASPSFTPDLSKIYLRLSIPEDNIYNELSKENLTGFVATDDNSLILANSQYANMMANTKNFYVQNSTNRAFDIGRGVLGAVTGTFNTAVGATTANYGTQISMLNAGKAATAAGIGATAALGGAGVIAAAAGQVISGIGNTIMNNMQQKANEKFTVDNLKNAPSSVKEAKGNIVFNSMYTKMGATIEEWDALINDKEIANDYMVKYGYNTNLIGNVFDYLNNSETNGRYYFNYIKAQIQNISGIPISNMARADIRARFDDGIRFWNQDTINYEKENYEKWLNPISIGRIETNQAGFVYDGTIKTIEFTVYDVNNNVVPSDMYTVTNNQAINMGEYNLTVVGKKLYQGTKVLPWRIGFIPVLSEKIKQFELIPNQFNQVILPSGGISLTTQTGFRDYGITITNILTDGTHSDVSYSTILGPTANFTYSDATYMAISGDYEYCSCLWLYDTNDITPELYYKNIEREIVEWEDNPVSAGGITARIYLKPGQGGNNISINSYNTDGSWDGTLIDEGDYKLIIVNNATYFQFSTTTT